jgi:hypothetical protein
LGSVWAREQKILPFIGSEMMVLMVRTKVVVSDADEGAESIKRGLIRSTVEIEGKLVPSGSGQRLGNASDRSCGSWRG